MRIYILEEEGRGFISAHATMKSAKRHLAEIKEFYKISDTMVRDMFDIYEAYLYDNDFE